jgi:hypothetical protein
MALPLLLLPPPHTHGCCYAASSDVYTGDPLCRLCLSFAMALPGLRPLGHVWLQFMIVCRGEQQQQTAHTV